MCLPELWRMQFIKGTNTKLPALCFAGRHHYHLCPCEGRQGLLRQAGDLPEAKRWVTCRLCTTTWLFQSVSPDQVLPMLLLLLGKWNGMSLFIKYFSPHDFLTPLPSEAQPSKVVRVVRHIWVQVQAPSFLICVSLGKSQTSLNLGFTIYKVRIMTYPVY